MRDSDGGIRVRERFVFASPREGMMTRVEQDVSYFCGTRKVVAFQYSEYDAGGDELRSGELQPPIETEVSSGTLPDLILEALC